MRRSFQVVTLLAVLILSTGLTIGLTYAPCYASLCSESFLPYETRLHIATYYALLASTGFVLFLRTQSPLLRRLSGYHLTRNEVPLLNKRISLGGAILSVWLIGITLATTPFWLSEKEYWALRTDLVDWGSAKIKLTVTGIIGHHIDFLLGLLIIPVSRNSLIGSVFEVHQSTLLYAHKLIAYLLLVGALAHSIAYYTFVAEYAPAPEDHKALFHIDNPTLTDAEVEAKGAWYSSNLGTGMIGFVFMIVITITALPSLRRKSYNTFYYLHIILSILIFIGLSIHASTDFYFLVPGLVLWLVDWAWRLFRGSGGGLSHRTKGVLENAGEGWYRITLPAAAKSLAADEEKQDLAVRSPVQSYYLNFPDVSRWQNHAFTAAKASTSASGPVFLFRRAQGKADKKLLKEWTWKLGALAPEPEGRLEMDVRVEGPYMPVDRGFETAAHVMCIVGGTGLTGAYSLALWWIEHRSQRDVAARFSLVWTVRDREVTRVREWDELEHMASGLEGMELYVHVSSENGRLRPREWLDQRRAVAQGNDSSGTGNSAWVYVSGPEGLLKDAESACIETRRDLRAMRDARGRDSLEWYVARWEV